MKTSLKDAVVLDDKQLKTVYGGSGNNIEGETDCGGIEIASQCSGLCYIVTATQTQKGSCWWENTLMLVGQNGKPDIYKYICTCVSSNI